MENQHRQITGYSELSQEEINLINEIKDVASKCGDLVDKIQNTDGVDYRWLHIGITDIQKGFMGLTRCVSKSTTF